VVLSEFTNGTPAVLTERLESAGLKLNCNSLRQIGDFYPTKKTNGLAVFSRIPIRSVAAAEETAPFRWLDLEVVNYGIDICAMHVPGWGKMHPIQRAREIKAGRAPALRKLRYKEQTWDALLVAAEKRIHSKQVIIGDLNTGLYKLDEGGKTFECVDHFKKLLQIGYRDAWRNVHGYKREYSLYSSAGNGFRLDHAFVSPTLYDSIENCAYCHAPRVEKLSDHSMLQLRLKT
jgi:exodeoxyribonuclease-3